MREETLEGERRSMYMRCVRSGYFRCTCMCEVYISLQLASQPVLMNS